MSGVNQGDIVRMELEDDTNQTWFYCRVGKVLDSGALECDIVDAQSWSNLALARAAALPKCGRARRVSHFGAYVSTVNVSGK